jgi:hypothetical protein
MSSFIIKFNRLFSTRPAGFLLKMYFALTALGLFLSLAADLTNQLQSCGSFGNFTGCIPWGVGLLFIINIPAVYIGMFIGLLAMTYINSYSAAVLIAVLFTVALSLILISILGTILDYIFSRRIHHV